MNCEEATKLGGGVGCSGVDAAPNLISSGRAAMACCSAPVSLACSGAYRVALFVRRFRRGRAGKFLEARIIPERIEHGIEPEQRRSERQV